MDQIFAHVIDQVALSGPAGIPLSSAVHAVVENARPALLTYLRSQFAARPHFFTLTPQRDDAVIVAHDALRRRALGFSPLEHPPLPNPAWLLLEAVGRAGPAGVLQADLGPVVHLAANMVHHYVSLLSARRLVARRKVVLTRQKKGAQEDEDEERPDKPGLAVTLTSVIVLARYASQICDVGPTATTPTTPAQILDNTTDVRLERMLAALRCRPFVRAERDLKIIAIPDSDRPADVTRDVFQRRRHRSYRSLRNKLLRFKVAAVTNRPCIGRSGKSIGTQPCLRLTESARNRLAGVKTEEEKRKVVHPLLQNGGGKLLAEVDVVEQVYQVLKRCGDQGIAVPELHEYLDNTGVTSAPSKRVRTIINAISKQCPTRETQFFEGSAMYMRIALTGADEAPAGGERRRKVGMTSLGERRQEIVLRLLEERKVIILETLGREVARAEKGELVRVDPKVMKRLIDDLILQKRVKMIKTTRPAIKENKRSQMLVLIALPEVHETGEEVKSVVSAVVNRALYGNQEDPKEAKDKRQADEQRGEHGGVAKETDFESSNRDSPEMRRKKASRATRKRRRGRSDSEDDEDDKDHDQVEVEVEAEEDEEPVVVDQLDDSNSVVYESEGDDEAGVDAERAIVTRTQQKPKANKEVRISARKPAKRARRSKNGANTEVNGSPPRVVSVSSPKTKQSEAEEVRIGATPEDDVQNNCGADQNNMSQESPNGSPAVLVQSSTRDLKGSRISRLRAVDYGCLKGKLARVRRFHKNLFDISRAANGVDLRDTPGVHHSTIEAARTVEPVAKFTIYSMLNEMTVGEYAATVGLHRDHGDMIKPIEHEKIASVLDLMSDELSSQVASRQVQGFVQVLTKLDLMRSDVDSQWLLSGAGIIRDFGKGLPSGVVPHGIVFTSSRAVDAFWVELEQFSRCKLSKKQTNLDLRTEEHAKEGERHIVSDVYFPTRWATGLHRLHKKEQLVYEIMLQRLSGVDVSLEAGNKLDTQNFLVTPLKWFNVEELDAEYEKLLGEGGQAQRHAKRQTHSAEKFVLYSRFRSGNPIPKWFHRDEEGQKNKSKDIARDNSCMLQLTRTPSSIMAHQIRAGMPSVFDSNHHRYFKSRAKKKAKAIAPEDAHVEAKKLVPLIRAIIKGRAISYYKNDVEGLDWKIIPSFVRFELRRATTELQESMDKESLRRAIVALCESTMVRASFDILSLKLVLKLREVADIESPTEAENSLSPRLNLSAMQLVQNWDALDTVSTAIMMEVQDDLRHHARVVINEDIAVNLSIERVRRSVLEEEFEMGGLRYGSSDVFAHMVAVMATRFRRIADLHLRGNIQYAVLFTQSVTERCDSRKNAEKEEGLEGQKHERENDGREGGNAPKQLGPDAGDMGGKAGSVAPLGTSASGMEDLRDPADVRVSSLTGRESRSQAQRNISREEGLPSRGDAQDQAKEQDRETVGRNLAVHAQVGENGSQWFTNATEAGAGLMESGVAKGDGSQSRQYNIACSTRHGGHEIAQNQPKCATELVELAICCVVREPAHAQWKAECVELLSRFRAEDLIKARDRLILRGAISFYGDRDRQYENGYFAPCKNEGQAERLAFLQGNGKAVRKWTSELERESEGCLEGLKLWGSVCGLQTESTIATSFVTGSTFFSKAGLSVIPEFGEVEDGDVDVDEDEDEDEDEDDEDVTVRIMLHYRYEQAHRTCEGEGVATASAAKAGGVASASGSEIVASGVTSGRWSASPVRCEANGGNRRAAAHDGNGAAAAAASERMSASGMERWARRDTGDLEMRQRISHAIAEGGRSGISLGDLLLCIRPRCDSERSRVTRALCGLLRDGGMKRFAVESGDAEWSAWSGVLYVCTAHCAGVSAWQLAGGAVNGRLVGSVHDTIVQTVVRTPCAPVEHVVRAACARHTSLPRRAVADLLFALDGRALRSDAAVRRAPGWRLLRAPPRFVDALAVAAWPRRVALSYHPLPAALAARPPAASAARWLAQHVL